VNWEAVAATSSALGATGVILTVIYLALQIRHNTHATRSQTYQHATGSLAEYAALLGSSEKLCHLWRLGLTNPKELNDDQSFQFALLLVSMFRRYENIFYQYQSGMIDADSWSGHREGILWYFHKTATHRLWKERRLTFSQSFRTFLENSTPAELQSAEGRDL